MTSFFDDMLADREKQASQEALYLQEDEQVKKEDVAISPFVFLNSLTAEKNHMIDNSSDPVRTEAEFAKVIFMVNNALSMGVDTIMYANEMNERYTLSPRMVYDYYFYSLRKTRAYNKWPKKDKSNEEAISAIKLFFNYSTREAARVVHLIPPIELDELIDRYKKIAE